MSYILTKHDLDIIDKVFANSVKLLDSEVVNGGSIPFKVQHRTSTITVTIEIDSHKEKPCTCSIEVPCSCGGLSTLT